jgi:NAD(P)-dependent dehydrogenase (short-subunit alcohol dehydrogenase family)
MPDYHGKVAVVTGAASGIGLAIAERAGHEGMTVVLADVDREGLTQARAMLDDQGMRVHAMEVDVSDRASVTGLAERVGREIGETWLLVNNAGVFTAAPLLETTIPEWEFIIGVNLWGVVYGLQAFLPGMVTRGSGHVVNTASLDGLLTIQNTGAYVASKHAVVAVTETLFRELALAGSGVGVSVLCPGAVATNILQSTRHWPARLGPRPELPGTGYPELDEVMQPSDVASQVFRAIGDRQFWIVTHPDQYAAALRARAEGVIVGTNPDDDSVDPNFRAATGRQPGSA